MGSQHRKSRRPRTHVIRLLTRRCERGTSFPNTHALEAWAEKRSILLAHPHYTPLPRYTKSTIATCFSPDGHTFASTHGDHTVKLICFQTNRVLHTLTGHPRTPWTVKYHPCNPHLLASGCIGGQVRIWDTLAGRCLYRASLDLPIISLSFHPSPLPGTHLLAIATFHAIWLWPYETCAKPYNEWQTERLLRCVCFPPPDGRHILIGLGNATRTPPPQLLQQQQQQQQQHNQYLQHHQHTQPQQPQQKTFHLFIWDFDVQKAMTPRNKRPPMAPARQRRRRVQEADEEEDDHDEGGGREGGEGGGGDGQEGGGREGGRGRSRVTSTSAPPPPPPAAGPRVQYYSSPLSRPRPLIENALLYNDGGFDISGCGRILVTCAEFHPRDSVLGPGRRGWGGGRDSGGDEGVKGVVDVSRLPHLVKLSLVSFLHDDEEDEEERGREMCGQGRRKQQPDQLQQQQQQQPEELKVEGEAAAATTTAAAAAAAAAASTPSWYNDVPAATGMGGEESDGGGIAADPKNKKEDQKMDGKQQEEDGEKKGKEVQEEEEEWEDEEEAGKEGYQYHGPRHRYLAPILSARPLHGVAMGGVTSVKLSATGSMVLLGYGGVRVSREVGREGEREGYHVVAEVYETGRMVRVRSLRSGGGEEGRERRVEEEEDVNIARFHPSAGHGFVYGTKQGRICVYGPKRGPFGVERG